VGRLRSKELRKIVILSPGHLMVRAALLRSSGYSAKGYLPSAGRDHVIRTDRNPVTPDDILSVFYADVLPSIFGTPPSTLLPGLMTFFCISITATALHQSAICKCNLLEPQHSGVGMGPELREYS